MPVEIQSTLISIIGGIIIMILGVLAGGYYERQKSKRRKIALVDVSSTSLVDPSQIGPLSITTSKEILTGKAKDRGVSVPVESAFSFVIRVLNKGDDDLVRPEINITLDDNASILSTTIIRTPIPQDKIEIKKDPKNPRSIQVIPEYLNTQKYISISLLSVNNTSDTCNVLVSGIGIKQEHFIKNEGSEKANMFFANIAAFLSGGMVFSLLALLYFYFTYTAGK